MGLIVYATFPPALAGAKEVRVRSTAGARCGLAPASLPEWWHQSTAAASCCTPSSPTHRTCPFPFVFSPQEDFGFMSVRAEKTNMRAAMLGLAVLTALEWHSGFCFF